jgi:hypothetical protein
MYAYMTLIYLFLLLWHIFTLFLLLIPFRIPVPWITVATVMWLNEHYSCFRYRDREYLFYANCRTVTRHRVFSYYLKAHHTVVEPSKDTVFWHTFYWTTIQL